MPVPLGTLNGDHNIRPSAVKAGNDDDLDAAPHSIFFMRQHYAQPRQPARLGRAASA